MTVVLGADSAVRRWCDEHRVHPDAVVPVFSPADAPQLYSPDQQVIQIQRPSRHIERVVAELKASRRPRRGLFVVFEGGEGSGKTTQARHLVKRLFDQGRDITVTREPGGTRLGQALRDLLLHEHSDPPTAWAEALMYSADRAHHVRTVVRPSLSRGAVVVCDRYLDSFDAYQGAGRELNPEHIEWLGQFATCGIAPDLTVLLDVDPALGLTRAAGRGASNRLDAEDLDFHQAVRQRLLDLAEAEPQNYLVLPGDGGVEEIAAAIAARVDEVLAEHARAAV